MTAGIESLGGLKRLLDQRPMKDRGARLELYYRFLPKSLARLLEKNTVPRHMRAMKPKTHLVQVGPTSWDICIGKKRLASTKPLEQLVDVAGKKVLMVATGPTAAEFDWETARQKYDFILALNGGTTFLKGRGVMPDLHLVVDRPFLEQAGDHLRAAPGVPLITNYSGLSSMAVLMPEFLEDRSFGMVEKVNSWYGAPRFEYDEVVGLNRGDDRMFHFPEGEADERYRIGWSSAPEYGYFTGSTVAYVGLQLLVRYGAAQIDIVGMDLSSAGHVYKDDMKNAGKLAAQYDDVLLPTFTMMAKALEGSEVVINNLSPVCPLPAELFPG